ncbi:hypothetical protein CSUB01_04479 [Colletotrichum sublineola]|uniref:Uncharacterized protein n=1 Tax=Colletotrichum sublineola TaxID=1173701 RepID=A0A066XN43_COLSU|nr:hypothetical protein CSUB01_04479 [Colletotrichum sublineola]
MDAPGAAAFRRKPLPGPPPGPPPPPDFDPFPQRHQPLRGARSTPNLRQSAAPSIYDPPPAYEEFPGVDSRGRLAVGPPGSGPGFGRTPSPSGAAAFFTDPPAAAHQEYRPYRPQAPPSPARGEQPTPSSAPSAFRAYPAEPAKSARPEILPYRPQPSSSFGPGGQPSPAPSDHGEYFPGTPATAPPGKSPYQPQPSSAFGSEKQSLAPPSPGPHFPGPPTAQTFPMAAYRPSLSPTPPNNTMSFAPPPTSHAPSEEASTTDSQAAEKSFWQTALEETKYFAGGLVSHPFEYTKHYSILRHSGALVWYRGPSTSVTVTVFSDAPLPPTRTVWLQQRGFSGSMGMNLKSLVGATTSWLDVTPSTRAAPADLPAADERGCQRDMKKFLKKAPRNLAAHAPRETYVVRIPAAADDGYFRLVLCSGGNGNGGGGGGGGKRKVLCPSPVFRVASTSTDASVFRGASLASMPLEAGIKAGSVVAATVVNKYVGPVAAVVQARAKNLSKAGVVTKHATHIARATAVVDKSGVKTHIAACEDRVPGGASRGRRLGRRAERAVPDQVRRESHPGHGPRRDGAQGADGQPDGRARGRQAAHAGRLLWLGAGGAGPRGAGGVVDRVAREHRDGRAGAVRDAAGGGQERGDGAPDPRVRRRAVPRRAARGAGHGPAAGVGAAGGRVGRRAGGLRGRRAAGGGQPEPRQLGPRRDAREAAGGAERDEPGGPVRRDEGPGAEAD